MPPPLPNQLTSWLDCALQDSVPQRITPYERRLGIAFVLQSCFPDVIALKVKTQGAYSRGTTTINEPVVQAGNELFRVLDKSPWLEKDRIARLHVEQREKLMQHTRIQPEVDMKTMVVSQWSDPVGVLKLERTRQWAEVIRLHLQASTQAEFLRSNGDGVHAPPVSSKPHRL